MSHCFQLSEAGKSRDSEPVTVNLKGLNEALTMKTVGSVSYNVDFNCFSLKLHVSDKGSIPSSSVDDMEIKKQFCSCIEV